MAKHGRLGGRDTARDRRVVGACVGGGQAVDPAWVLKEHLHTLYGVLLEPPGWVYWLNHPSSGSFSG